MWVFLTDKHDVVFDPRQYFDVKAIERRQREGLPLQDSTDFPLNENYVAHIATLCDSVCGTSRWFNAIACVASDVQLQKIAALAFVKNIQHMAYAPVLTELENVGMDDLDEDVKKILQGQTESMQYSLLHNNGYVGKGVRIAVFDAGFDGFLQDEAFQHIIAGDKIKATYDFPKDKKYVFNGHSHGTNVMSCIAGKIDENYIGCATDAEFLLARTEQAIRESKVEEENWVMSLEWADKWGADIVNSSLGYTNQFYFSKDMNGKKSIISQAAAMAAHKGILVCNSAGNEGNTNWEVISAPADADSILTIGGIAPSTGYHASFSSYGPTSDFRLKPNLCAFGYAVVTSNNNLYVNSGTSFSSPLVAGFAACIRQMHPEWTLRQLYDELQHSGHLYPYFDYAHGYGIPQASYFIQSDSTDAVELDSTAVIRFEYQQEMNRFKICVNNPDSNEVSDEEEDEDLRPWMNPQPDDSELIYNGLIDFMYMHVQDASGMLLDYKMTKPGIATGAFIADKYADDCTVRVHWKGITTEKTIRELKEQR